MNRAHDSYIWDFMLIVEALRGDLFYALFTMRAWFKYDYRINESVSAVKSVSDKLKHKYAIIVLFIDWNGIVKGVVYYGGKHF